MQLLNIVTEKQAADFSSRWTHNGLVCVLNDMQLKFAADFANVVVTSFVEQQMAKAKAAAQQKPQVVE